MNCIVCGNNRIIGTKCSKCGFDFTKEEMAFIFQFNDKELPFFKTASDSKNKVVNRRYSNQMTYSQYISELEKLCKNFTIADFDIQMFIRRNRLDTHYGITVNDVKKDIKTLVGPICEKANIETKTLERYSNLRQKYGRLDYVARTNIVETKPSGTYEEYKEFLSLEKKIADLLANSNKTRVLTMGEYFIRLEKLFKHYGTIPSDRVLYEFINDCVTSNGPRKTIEEVKEDLVKVILGTWK